VVKKLAAQEKNTAEPPSTCSRFSVGISTPSNIAVELRTTEHLHEFFSGGWRQHEFSLSESFTHCAPRNGLRKNGRADQYSRIKNVLVFRSH
jgi:hypothetical protein